MMAIVELTSASDAVKLGHRGPLLVSCFAGWPNPAAMRAVADAQKSLAQKFGKIVTITVIPPINVAVAKASAVTMQQAPDDRAASLKASVSVGEELSNITIAAAMVIMPRGLVAVMISSFMAAMALVVRSRTPLKTFRTLPEAIAWLESQPLAPKLTGALEDVNAWLGL